MNRCTMTRELDDAIARGEQALSPPHFDLPLVNRWEIWNALGPRDAGTFGDGHARRATLGILAAEKVLPIWDAWRPGDDRPRRFLDATRQALAAASAPVLDADLGLFDVELDNLATTPGNDAKLAVGWAAVAAYRVLLHDEPHMTQPPVEPVLDPPDPAFEAARAAAGGWIFSAAADSTKRREFWRWWLHEAVPAAARATSR